MRATNAAIFVCCGALATSCALSKFTIEYDAGPESIGGSNSGGGQGNKGGTTGGGVPAIGGTTQNSGGATQTSGGATQTSGGAMANGGTTNGGGSAGNGGNTVVGGTFASGGVSTVGGTTASGGATSATDGTAVPAGGTTAATGGSKPTGGTTGIGGTATGGSGGSTGMGGGIAFCTSGCARLSVPLTAADTQTIFDLYLVAAGTGQSKNLDGATIQVKACTQDSAWGGLWVWVQNGATVAADAATAYGFFAYWTNLTALVKCDTGAMTTVELDLSTASFNTLDPTMVEKLTINVAAGEGAGTWANPTVVYIESVTVSGGVDTIAPIQFNNASKLVVDTLTASHTPVEPGTGILGINIYNGTNGANNVLGSSVSFYQG